MPREIKLREIPIKNRVILGEAIFIGALLGVIHKEINVREKDVLNNPLLDGLVLPGTVRFLAKLIDAEPQKDEKGHLKYLLTSGQAVEAITGVSRFHHDTDLVIFNWSNGGRYAADYVTPQRYWADMRFEPEYLEETAWTANFLFEGIERAVLTVHPAIIVIQKLSNAFGRQPRSHDQIDVKHLINFWQECQKDSIWLSIFAQAIQALPFPERPTTEARLAQIMRNQLD